MCRQSVASPQSWRSSVQPAAGEESHVQTQMEVLDGKIPNVTLTDMDQQHKKQTFVTNGFWCRLRSVSSKHSHVNVSKLGVDGQKTSPAE